MDIKQLFFLFFSFKNRISKPYYIKLLIAAMGLWLLSYILILTIVNNLERTSGSEFMVQAMGVLSTASMVSITSLITRRLRDIGLPWHFIFIYVGLIILGNLDIAKSLFGWMVLIVPIVLCFIPSWDEHYAMSSIFALMRRACLLDGGINPAARNHFASLCVNVFELPQPVSVKAEHDFQFGHQDYEPTDFHAETIKAVHQNDESALTDILGFVTSVAAASGEISSEKISLFEQIASELGVDQILPDHIQHLIGLLAKMAKADGVVSKVEINLIDDFYQYGLRLGNKTRQEAIALFQTAKTSKHSFHFYADAFANAMQEFGHEGEQIKQMAFSLLIDLASSDGEIHSTESEILEYVAKKLNVDHEQAKAHGGDSKSQHGFSESHSDEAYYAKVLGIPVGADKASIRKAYRDKASKNHPDKVAHLSQSIQEFAEQEMKVIQEAYEFFKTLGRA